jgi:hypothetical protein
MWPLLRQPERQLVSPLLSVYAPVELTVNVPLVRSAASVAASAVDGDHHGNAASALSASDILFVQFVTMMGAAFLGALLL